MRVEDDLPARHWDNGLVTKSLKRPEWKMLWMPYVCGDSSYAHYGLCGNKRYMSVKLKAADGWGQLGPWWSLQKVWKLASDFLAILAPKASKESPGLKSMDDAIRLSLGGKYCM